VDELLRLNQHNFKVASDLRVSHLDYLQEVGEFVFKRYCETVEAALEPSATTVADHDANSFICRCHVLSGESSTNK
jgi:hypothetical protein